MSAGSAMSRCEFAPESRADIQQIYEYVAERSPRNALRLIQRIEERCYLLADYPYLGMARPEFGLTYRSFAVPSTGYIIVYRPIEDGVDIHRVYHGSQNFRRLFQQ